LLDLTQGAMASQLRTHAGETPEGRGWRDFADTTPAELRHIDLAPVLRRIARAAPAHAQGVPAVPAQRKAPREYENRVSTLVSGVEEHPSENQRLYSP